MKLEKEFTCKVLASLTMDGGQLKLDPDPGCVNMRGWKRARSLLVFAQAVATCGVLSGC